MFEGFERRRIQTTEVAINCRVGGNGPPLLLLHGYPQTHVMWHKVVEGLAERFTVVAADLRGYGDSDKPGGGEWHAAYAKRAMAKDQVEVMEAIGFERFSVVGHDRGARVTHRMALDHPERIVKAVVMDIAPTLTMYQQTDMAFASAYYHWFFLIQPYDLPERLIGADPDYYLERKIASWQRVGNDGTFAPDALAEYKRCFRDQATIHATCEDYRAAATIDLEHDQQDLDRRIECPLHVLWGAQGVVGQTYAMPDVWRDRAVQVSGRALDCGHYLAEEVPAETLRELQGFL